ncbi:ubiquitin domain-containing protein 2-like protein [Dinothrombium tinctorium]|uniref:Ubiquitin domain-containing protein 2-like protein n=1 Tax=Dinothrombium tinctorium TaxID=1965070 RepID=A0A3S5WGS3_9ACAR|nr:ubiquitin domain-containing protein 2-like protein [Dinothrombium tinctorium]
MFLYLSKCMHLHYSLFTLSSFLLRTVTLGKNQPLKQEKPKWKSDVPLTEGQLRSKRDEFWETAPAFEGRKEIWDALKAAAYASENNDYDLAQAILDGALISLPNGTLLDCYDELGNRYQLPIYCLSAPINLIEEGSDSESPSPESEPISEGRFGGEEISVKFRISSSCKDVKMSVFSKETILSAKRKLATIEGIEPNKQRWFFGGRLLNDKMKIEDAKLQSGFVVQVIISSPTSSKSD